MNASSIFGGDPISVLNSVVVSLVLGSAHRPYRSVSLQRRAADLIDRDVRDQTEHCDLRQANGTRPSQGRGERHNALMQQARTPGQAPTC